ncbi:MAG TPA: ammonia-forming cytochrome c nitrite reductase subunit c552 [Candidatus Limnocylindrales bacterium]|nr:ammonia-forming cytochrome c nitrite reductase subunit c552 [Candidatus Limnocylindrales bacterium]
MYILRHQNYLYRAGVLKVQHPEFEYFQGSVYANFGLSCVDCHMPRIQDAQGNEFTQHWLTIPLSYPLEMSDKTKGAIGDVSLRHAAVAAGLGQLGRNNLVIHPRLGSRVVFTGLITDLEFTSDPKAEGICTNCNLCVENCPGQALEDEGKTHLMRCIKNSQPYGISAVIRFWTQLLDSPPEEQKKMLANEHFWKLFQASFIGFQYFCFNCLKSCFAEKKR